MDATEFKQKIAEIYRIAGELGDAFGIGRAPSRNGPIIYGLSYNLMPQNRVRGQMILRSG